MDVVIPRPAVVLRGASERGQAGIPSTRAHTTFFHPRPLLSYRRRRRPLHRGLSPQRSASLQPSDSTTSKCFEGCLRSWLLRASPPRIIHCRRPPPLDEVEFELARPLDAQLLAKEGILPFFFFFAQRSRGLLLFGRCGSLTITGRHSSVTSQNNTTPTPSTGHVSRQQAPRTALTNYSLSFVADVTLEPPRGPSQLPRDTADPYLSSQAPSSPPSASEQ